jgi:hypothetical protein
MIDVKGAMETGLVGEKIFSDYPDLRMYKYRHKVFYKALWNVHPDIVECRGLVLDKEGNVVALPLRKVFNYGENGATFRKNSVVKLVEKRNGFFAACSLYQGEVLVSTTGSLDSDFVRLAKTKLDLAAVKDTIQAMAEGYRMKGTLMFEICHENDPHIVPEDIGAYLIAFRVHTSGMLVPEEVLDKMADAYNHVTSDDSLKVMRPAHTYCTFQQALKKLKTCKHEGYMAYKKGTDKCIKLKSPYYLTKKFLMRMSVGKVEHMFAKTDIFMESIDEEFYDVVNYITKVFSLDDWKGFKDQQRRNIIEGYFYGQ